MQASKSGGSRTIAQLVSRTMSVPGGSGHATAKEVVRVWTAGISPHADHSLLIFAALMIGHHFSISALWKVPSASGVCCSRGNSSMPRSANR